MTAIKLLSCAIFLLSAFGINGYRPRKIIGPADRVFSVERPYQVALLKMNFVTKKVRNHCSGAILDGIHISTAAHCVNKKDLSSIKVAAGFVDMNDPDKMYRAVSKVHIHPGFRRTKESFVENDIAIVTIDSPLLLGYFIKSIELPIANKKPNQIGEIAGWGRTNLDYITLNSTTRFLLKTKMKILRSKDCLREVPETQFCAIDPDQESTCGPGDSGSPFVIKNFVAGIGISGRKSPCSPSYYTNVFSYLSFIRDILNTPTENHIDFQSSGKN